MSKVGITISEEKEYLVTYIITRGMWSGNSRNRKFSAIAGDIGQVSAMKVTAKSYVDAKGIAYSKINSNKLVNEYVKILRAVPIPKKKEVV